MIINKYIFIFNILGFVKLFFAGLSFIGKSRVNFAQLSVGYTFIGGNFRFEIWYQTEMIRNAVFEGIAQNLGFEIPRTYDLSEGHLFNSEELSVQIQFYELGSLGDDLDLTGNTDKEKQDAIRRRADQVVNTIPPIASNKNDLKPIIGAFIELPGIEYYKFKESKDPKTDPSGRLCSSLPLYSIYYAKRRRA